MPFRLQVQYCFIYKSNIHMEERNARKYSKFDAREEHFKNLFSKSSSNLPECY